MSRQAKRKRFMRIRYTNRFKCLVCYLIAFALPLLWQYAGLIWIYPYRLAGTAPDLAAHLLKAFPFLESWLVPLTERTAMSTAASAQAFRSAMAAREDIWLAALALCALTGWGLTLLMQLGWRFAHRKTLLTARTTLRAVRSYRLVMLLVWLVNLGLAAFVWHFGLQHVPGRTGWDWMLGMGIHGLLPLSAIIVSRLAASSAISGKGAFFKRL